MIVRKPQAAEGIRFAWMPVITPEGKVWLEFVHYRYHDHGLGGCDYDRVHYKADSFGLPKIDYARWVPDKEYDQGKRAFAPVYDRAAAEAEIVAECSGKVFAAGGANHCAPFADMGYATPPMKERCRNLSNSGGPTPCWFPHCDCMRPGQYDCWCGRKRDHNLGEQHD